MLQLILTALQFALTVQAHGYMNSPAGLANKQTYGAVRGFNDDNPDKLEGPGNPKILCHGLPKSRVVPVSFGGNGASHSIGLTISAKHPGPCSAELIDSASGKIVEIGSGNNCVVQPGSSFDWTFTLKNMEQVTCTDCILRFVWSSTDLIPKEYYQSYSDIQLIKGGGGGSTTPDQPNPPAPKPNTSTQKPNPPTQKPTAPPAPAPTTKSRKPKPTQQTKTVATTTVETKEPSVPQPQPPTTGSGATHTVADCKVANQFLCAEQCGKTIIQCTGVGAGVSLAPLDAGDAKHACLKNTTQTILQTQKLQSSLRQASNSANKADGYDDSDEWAMVNGAFVRVEKRRTVRQPKDAAANNPTSISSNGGDAASNPPSSIHSSDSSSKSSFATSSTPSEFVFKNDPAYEGEPSSENEASIPDQQMNLIHDARQSSWSDILDTLSSTRKLRGLKETRQAPTWRSNKNIPQQLNVVVKPGFIQNPHAVERRALPLFPIYQDYREKEVEKWYDPLDKYHRAWTEHPREDPELLKFIRNNLRLNCAKLEAFALPYLAPHGLDDKVLNNLNPEHIWKLYLTVSTRSPGTLNALKPHHWVSLIRHTLHAFLPTNPSKDTTVIPAHVPRLLVECSRQIVLDMKQVGLGLTPEVFAGLYRASIADPRTAIATHEIARARMTRERTKRANLHFHPTVSEESIRELIAVLLYGGGRKEYANPFHFQRANGILSFRNSVKGAPTLVHIARVVEDLWQDLEELSIWPSQPTLLAFLDAFGTFQDKHMVGIVQSRLDQNINMKKSAFNIPCYRGLIAAHFNCGNYAAVMRKFNAYQASNLAIDGETLSLALASLFHLKEYSNVLKTFAAVSSAHSINPKDDDIELILKALVLSKEDEASEKKYLQSVNHYINDAIISNNGNSINPYVTSRSYMSLLEVCAKLGYRSITMTTYNNLKAIVQLFHLEKRSQLPPIVARRSVSQVLKLLSSESANLSTAATFFRSEVLDRDRVRHHWVMNALSHKESYERDLWLARQRLENAKAAKGVKPKVIEELEKELSFVKLEVERGIQLRSGTGGPFEECYRAIDAGFRQGLEVRVAKAGGGGIGSGVDRSEDLMKLEETLKKLEEEELKLIGEVLEEEGLKFRY
ncbi:hypothetical protein HDU77_005256 [Chytriomyces hyalinus]|nr:hypothetical protein HDU77_005256 [Chytriomyces hyalinus]